MELPEEDFSVDESVPDGLVMAFYKGTRPWAGGILNIIGRRLDHGPYSHTELILPEKYNRISIGSSYIDGGVRFKPIGYTSVGNWDFLPIPDADGIIAEYANHWTVRHNAKAYDLRGNLRFLTNIATQDADKWFCVESNMAMLGYPEAHAFRYGPSHAAVTLAWHFNTEMVYTLKKPSKLKQLLTRKKSLLEY